jgi:alkylresorcinol/alkylpyrone synthase
MNASLMAFAPETLTVEGARLLSFATAVPQNKIRQDEVRASAKAYFGAKTGIFEHLEPVFANAQIDTRYACQPFDWYLDPHDFGEKTALYTERARTLGLEVAEKALTGASLGAADIDAIVCVSSTGVMTPASMRG